jgi:oligoribonuclease NrnB/cAMP/cGMP phosphodiesterase (DHH superfamily)
MSRIVIIYHAKCMDGLGAAWVAKQRMPTAEMYAAAYGSAPPDVTDAEVFILDFSYPRDVLLAMSVTARRVTVIDHHATSEELLKGLPNTVFDKTKSGAVLTWHYFNGTANKPPALLAYIQDRDLWQWALPDSRAVNEYLRHSVDLAEPVERQLAVLDSVHRELAKVEFGNAVVQQGTLLLSIKERRVCSAVSSYFWLTFNLGDSNIKLPCTFAESDIVSEVGQALALHSFYKTGCVILPMSTRGTYGLSFRSLPTVDLAKVLAESYGGGGHAQAAGCGISPTELAVLIGNSEPNIK